MLQSLIILVALLWTLSSSSSSCLNWGAQNWTQYSRWGLTRAEQRGRRNSLDLPVTLFFFKGLKLVQKNKKTVKHLSVAQRPILPYFSLGVKNACYNITEEFTQIF